MIRQRTHATKALIAAMSVTSLATLYACGGGDDGAPDASFDAPAPFVPVLQALAAGASEADKHMQITRAIWARNPPNSIQDPVYCAVPGTADPILKNFDVVPMTELFDGFYYTGMWTVGQFVQKTPDGGFVLYDTMYSQADRGIDITLAQLASAGLDLKNLRAIVLTHGHSDHDGGVPAIFTAAGQTVPVYAGSQTPGLTTTKPYRDAAVPFDSSNLAPQEVNVAGIRLTALSTPGHYAGDFSYVLPVSYKNQSHKLAYWGGSGFPSAAADGAQYLNSVERMYALVKATGADGSINSHTNFDHSGNRAAAIRAQGGIAVSDPMIQGNATILVSYAALHGCAGALLSGLDSTAHNPVWRPTTTEFYGAKALGSSPGGKQSVAVAARVANYFQPLGGVTVSFSDAGKTGSCSALTNADGIASCTLLLNEATAGQPSQRTLNAEAATLSHTDAVDLGSVAVRTLGM